MSSAEPARPAAPRGAVLAAVALAVLLAGCRFEPLYGTRTDPAGTVRPGPSAELAAIAVDPPADRTQQLIRNELVFLFTGGGTPAQTRYGLRMLTDIEEDALAVEQDGDLPASVLVSLEATFILTEVSTGRTLLTGKSFRTANYALNNQRFASVRARREAIARAAEEVARDMATRIAAYFDARAA